jgi:hypothetical protein
MIPKLSIQGSSRALQDNLQIVRAENPGRMNSANANGLSLAKANEFLHGLIKEMGRARFDGNHLWGVLDTFDGAKLTCGEQSYIIAKALALNGYVASLAVNADKRHVVVVIQDSHQMYAADPRMNTPFEKVSKDSLQKMLNRFSLMPANGYALKDVRRLNANIDDILRGLAFYGNDSQEIKYILKAPLR